MPTSLKIARQKLRNMPIESQNSPCMNLRAITSLPCLSTHIVPLLFPLKGSGSAFLSRVRGFRSIAYPEEFEVTRLSLSSDDEKPVAVRLRISSGIDARVLLKRSP